MGKRKRTGDDKKEKEKGFEVAVPFQSFQKFLLFFFLVLSSQRWNNENSSLSSIATLGDNKLEC